MRTYAWIELSDGGGGQRAAYPYEWWFDGRSGNPEDPWSDGNTVPSINNWLLLGADALAYAYHLSADEDYLNRAAALFRTGSHDPFYESDVNAYSSTKETVNSLTYGNVFLYEWTQRSSDSER